MALVRSAFSGRMIPEGKFQRVNPAVQRAMEQRDQDFLDRQTAGYGGFQQFGQTPGQVAMMSLPAVSPIQQRFIQAQRARDLGRYDDIADLSARERLKYDFDQDRLGLAGAQVANQSTLANAFSNFLGNPFGSLGAGGAGAGGAATGGAGGVAGTGGVQLTGNQTGTRQPWELATSAVSKLATPGPQEMAGIAPNQQVAGETARNLDPLMADLRARMDTQNRLNAATSDSALNQAMARLQLGQYSNQINAMAPYNAFNAFRANLPLSTAGPLVGGALSAALRGIGGMF